MKGQRFQITIRDVGGTFEHPDVYRRLARAIKYALRSCNLKVETYNELLTNETAKKTTEETAANRRKGA